MTEALASRHIGRAIRAYRTHPHHGRHPIPQEKVAGWLGITQSKLSRIENGPRVEQLDQLIHWARILSIPPEHLWFTLPEDHSTTPETSTGTEVDREPLSPDLGANSAVRTKTLLDWIESGSARALEYLAPTGAVAVAREFLSSQSRVYLLTGPPGCGKTSLTHHLARELADTADVQLHAVESWNSQDLDLATEILRYASLPAGEDPLLTLEHATAALGRPLLVIIDGVKAHRQFIEIGRQLDRILRQVTTDAFRAVLVVRTPPELAVSAYPVLAASVHQSAGPTSHGSYELRAWTPAEAQRAWNSSRTEGEPAFAELSPAVQRLARLALYMHLLKMTGAGTSAGDANPYRLIDSCVRALVRASDQEVDAALARLANAACQDARDLLPAQLNSVAPPPIGDLNAAHAAGTAPSQREATERPIFDHDVIREYFLATRIAELAVELGRSVATVGLFNDLAAKAESSATARGVFELAVFCLDAHDPELLAAVALAPTTKMASTLPLLLGVACTGSPRFVTDEVLRGAARRCEQDSALGLARALLVTPAITNALGEQFSTWMLGLLRRFGAAIWADAVRAVEQTFDARAAGQLLARADLRDADEAAFFARHYSLFFADDQDLTGHLETLLAHADWRVRAALAEGLQEQHATGNPATQTIVDRLVHDADYKVRAAVGRTIGHIQPATAVRYLPALLNDENWHVRACALQSAMQHHPRHSTPSLLAQTATDAVAAGDWQDCPAHMAGPVQRLMLLHGAPNGETHPPGRPHALFTLLRELRTGWARLPTERRDALVAEALQCPTWLVRREAKLLTGQSDVEQQMWPVPGPRSREAFRRLRNQRSIQVALDLHDIDQAAEIAAAAAHAGAELIEVGDPLIKQTGIVAVERIKQRVPGAMVVAEMMSADWGRDQVELAAQAGADIVLLIGPASVASVAAAVEAGRRLGVPIVLDVPTGRLSKQWVDEMEATGVDGFTITSNIDLGVRGRHPLDKARAIRGWTRLPVAISGGFSTTDHRIIGSPDWDILIVGRGITEAVQPELAARQFITLAARPWRETS